MPYGGMEPGEMSLCLSHKLISAMVYAGTDIDPVCEESS